MKNPTRSIKTYSVLTKVSGCFLGVPLEKYIHVNSPGQQARFIIPFPPYYHKLNWQSTSRTLHAKDYRAHTGVRPYKIYFCSSGRETFMQSGHCKNHSEAIKLLVSSTSQPIRAHPNLSPQGTEQFLVPPTTKILPAPSNIVPNMLKHSRNEFSSFRFCNFGV